MVSTECIACGSKDVLPLYRTHDRHYGISGEFDLVRCVCCGLISLDPMPTEELLSTYYSEDYYAYLPQEKSVWWKRFIRHLLCLQIKTQDPKFSRTGNFLDIGCGSGDYLKIMEKRGWKVMGVEPSVYGTLAGQSEGLDIYHGSLLEASYPTDFFDYVRSNHSFEHVPNPVDVLQEIHRILRPGGKVYIGIPNTDSFAFRLFGKYWWYLGTPLHTYNYSVKSITSLLHKTGFRNEMVLYNSNFWSLLGSLQIFMNRNMGEKSNEGMLVRSKILNVFANLAEKYLDHMQEGDAIEIICEKPIQLNS